MRNQKVRSRQSDTLRVLVFQMISLPRLSISPLFLMKHADGRVFPMSAPWSTSPFPPERQLRNERAYQHSDVYQPSAWCEPSPLRRTTCWQEGEVELCILNKPKHTRYQPHLKLKKGRRWQPAPSRSRQSHRTSRSFGDWVVPLVKSGQTPVRKKGRRRMQLKDASGFMIEIKS